jgi:peptidoglycan/xylan/chitin deacetylase (PgdA/CDA1 family)
VNPAQHSRASTSAILLYHQVGDPAADPFSQFVSPEHFAGQMAVVARHRAGALAARARGAPGGSVAAGTVAVTFDDGYLSNLRLAKPALERAGVPATVFVTTAMTGGGRDFWWNDLAVALEHAPTPAGELCLAVGGRERVWAIDEVDRRELLFEIWAWLRLARPDDVLAAVATARAWAGLAPAGPPAEDARCMTVAELHELLSGGLVDIGAHTRTHPMLSALAPAEQREEIAGSRSDLEAWLGRPVATFAYPFGHRVTEYRAAAVRAVRASGFEAAVAVVERPLSARSPTLELPRHAVPDIPADEFAVWLAERLDPPRSRRRLLEWGPVRALRERVSAPGRL